MKNDDIRKLFEKTNAVVTNSHFVYTKKADGWYHGDTYINKDALYLCPRLISRLCREIVMRNTDLQFDVAVGATMGGIALTQWVAYWRSELTGQKTFAVYLEEEDIVETRIIGSPELANFGNPFIFRVNGDVQLFLDNLYTTAELRSVAYQVKTGTRRIARRGYNHIIIGNRCFVIEDVINSGATVVKLLDAIRDLRGEAVGVGALCNRSGGRVSAETLGVPVLNSLMDVDLQMYKEDACPICEKLGPQSVRLDLGKGKDFLQRMGFLPLPS